MWQIIYRCLQKGSTHRLPDRRGTFYILKSYILKNFNIEQLLISHMSNTPVHNFEAKFRIGAFTDNLYNLSSNIQKH